jgi:hypothetical protein
MGATIEGNKKSHETLKRKLGEVGYKAHMAAIGAKGGKASVRKGFAVTGKQFNIGTTERADYDEGVE